MMFHMTPRSSGYLENMWFWTADHDIDAPAQDMIDVFTGRSVLIESRGPTWVHSASSEHAQLYQWQLAGAQNIYLGHIQSESPYYQAGIPSTQPYSTAGKLYMNDPNFSNCPAVAQPGATEDMCNKAWALRIIQSRDVYVYGGGFYSFFKDYSDKCATTAGAEECQNRLVDISKSEGIWLYDIWTVGTAEVISPRSQR